MNRIEISPNKTLKLQNVLIYSTNWKIEDTINLNLEINKMNAYIRTHGAMQIGPLIQYNEYEMNEMGKDGITMTFLLQANNFIHNVEKPYKMKPILRVKNCLYARYTGPEEKIRYAYDKLGVYAFENEIEIVGSNYTIYVDRNESDETIVADIFMPWEEEG